MRWNEMYIAGTGSCFPQRDYCAQAVAEGRYDADEHEKNGYRSISIAGEMSAADLAVSAARPALARSGHAGDDIGLVLHASLHHQGQDHWTAASYIQERTAGGRAPALEIKQGSNGGLAGLVLALSYLSVHQGQGAALVTTADKFCPPVYDRYNSDKWMVLGDGGSAAVLSRRGGFARVLATAMDSDPGLEEMYRGDGFSDAPFASGLPLDLRERKRGYMDRVGLPEVALRCTAGLQNVVKEALGDAGTDIDGIARFVFPNVGKSLVQWDYLDTFGIDEDRTTWAWGSGIGHAGAGDQFGGLNHLAETGALAPGDRVVLAGSGIGFSWACAVLEIVEAPEWEPSDA
ncbi:ketoacyl-ACP synthase III family protein [Streptomyces sp. cg2]|uniref:ketoacyl-ACP synthase III family protein n=1 Tax=Streptomyces sp. cg2 TaxID=3238799 RepID=UPI0034E1B6B3